MAFLRIGASGPRRGPESKNLFDIIRPVAGIAQLVEHLFCKQGVTSSSLVASTTISHERIEKEQSAS
jgi:hypothetical protein